MSLHGALKNHVILWIAAHSVQGSCHCDMRPVADVFLQDCKDFLIFPGELPYKRRANFRDDLIADSNGVVTKHRVESALRGAAEQSWLIGATVFGIPLGLLLLTSSHPRTIKVALRLTIVVFPLYSFIGARRGILHQDCPNAPIDFSSLVLLDTQSG